MGTELKEPGIPAGILADAELVAQCVASRQPIPPEVVRRVRARSEKVTQRLRRQYGALDIGVPAIREFRGALPEP